MADLAFDPVTAALEVGGKLIDRWFPDPAAKAQATMDLLKLKQSGELAQLTADTDIAKAQIAVNMASATSSAWSRATPMTALASSTVP